MLSGVLEAGRGDAFVLAGLQVGVDKLNQPVQILGRDSLVLLVEVVYVAVEDLDEQFN